MKSSSGLLCDSQRQVPWPLSGLVSAVTSSPHLQHLQACETVPSVQSPRLTHLYRFQLHITPVWSQFTSRLSRAGVCTSFSAPFSGRTIILLGHPHSENIYVLFIFSHEFLCSRFFFNFFLFKKNFFYVYLLRRGTRGGQRSTARMSAGNRTQVLRLVPRGLHS